MHFRFARPTWAIRYYSLSRTNAERCFKLSPRIRPVLPVCVLAENEPFRASELFAIVPWRQARPTPKTPEHPATLNRPSRSFTGRTRTSRARERRIYIRSVSMPRPAAASRRHIAVPQRPASLSRASILFATLHATCGGDARPQDLRPRNNAEHVERFWPEERERKTSVLSRIPICART